MNADITCSKCSLIVSDYVRLQCEHHLCQDCFYKYCRTERISVESSFLFKCEICLKTQRMNSQPSSNRRHQEHIEINRMTTNNVNVNNNHMSRDHTMNAFDYRKPQLTNELYCFNCNQKTFSMASYIEGVHHRNHRVKTYEAAVVELKEQHLQSMQTLQSKSCHLTQKEHTLETHLIQLNNQFKQTLIEIEQYYDSLVAKINQKRNQMVFEADRFYKEMSLEIKNNIEAVKQNNSEVKRLMQVIRQFYNGTVTINQLVHNERSLKEALELKNFKSKLPITTNFPRLIQSLDLHFHIENSLRFSRGQLEQSTIPAQSGGEQKIQRKVRLLEKVRDKLGRTQLLFR